LATGRNSGPSLLPAACSHALSAVVAALEAAGVECTNGKQPGVRMKAAGSASIPIDQLNASNDD
jgi:hypothetical protein